MNMKMNIYESFGDGYGPPANEYKYQMCLFSYVLPV